MWRIYSPSINVYGHPVVLDPIGFCLCSCVDILSIDSPCHHFGAVLVAMTKIERAYRFDAKIIDPR